MHIIIIKKPNQFSNKEDKESIKKIEDIIKNYEKVEIISAYDAQNNIDKILKSQTIISAGGDGTFLTVAEIIASEGSNIPILGITTNKNSIGALNTLKYNEIDLIEDILEAKKIEKRPTINIEIYDKIYTAVNDVFIGGKTNQKVELKILKPEKTIRGTGAIIATYYARNARFNKIKLVNNKGYLIQDAEFTDNEKQEIRLKSVEADENIYRIINKPTIIMATNKYHAEVNAYIDGRKQIIKLNKVIISKGNSYKTYIKSY